MRTMIAHITLGFHSTFFGDSSGGINEIRAASEGPGIFVVLHGIVRSSHCGPDGTDTVRHPSFLSLTIHSWKLDFCEQHVEVHHRNIDILSIMQNV